MQMIVRFKVDACLPLESWGAGARISSHTRVIDIPAVVSAASTLSPLPTSEPSGSQSSASRSQQPTAGPNEAPQAAATNGGAAALVVRQGGMIIPQASVIQLKTRPARATPQVKWGEIAPQLYLSQTRHFFLALHDSGAVSQVRKLGNKELTLREAEVQPALRRLRAVLEAIQKRVVEHGSGALLSLVCRGEALYLFEREGGDGAVPEEVMQRFEW